jgi:hypothetical protein
MSDPKKNRIGMRPKTSDAPKPAARKRVLYVSPTGKKSMRNVNVKGEFL